PIGRRQYLVRADRAAHAQARGVDDDRLAGAHRQGQAFGPGGQGHDLVQDDLRRLRVVDDFQRQPGRLGLFEAGQRALVDGDDLDQVVAAAQGDALVDLTRPRPGHDGAVDVQRDLDVLAGQVMADGGPDLELRLLDNLALRQRA